jgi:hypothetical protein
VGRRLIRPAEDFIAELPYSEVCMHLRVAGTQMRARLEPNRMVQLLQPDGAEFSFPITAAEAGLDTDERGAWLITAEQEPEPPAEDPPSHQEVADQQRARMLLDPVSEPLAAPDRHTWRGEIIHGPAGPLYWHPGLGYVSVPDPENER